MLGYAIDTNVRHVRTVVVDQAGTQESRQLLEEFENSQDFRIVAQGLFGRARLSQVIVAGKARVGIMIPEDYSRQLEAGETAQILVLVDGTESSVAGGGGQRQQRPRPARIARASRSATGRCRSRPGRGSCSTPTRARPTSSFPA